jgi:hypothetical protein
MSILLEKRSCLFVPDPDPGLGSEPHCNITFDATILFEDAGSRPENNKDTPSESNWGPPQAKETNPNTPDPAPPKKVVSIEEFVVSNRVTAL